MSDAERELEHGGEHQVTPLELFFDLVFVFAFTQVTRLLVDDPTWGGVFRGMLVLAALWWAWSVYAWLTSAMDVDEGGVRLVMLAAMAAMFGAALAVPGAFGDDAVLFGVAYLLVRLLHLVLSAIVARDDPDRRGALAPVRADRDRSAPLLLVVAGFLEGDARIAVWLVALAIDYLGPVVIGVGRGWRVAPEHFAERHGLIILIALGESIIAIGLGAGLELDTGVIVAAALGIVVVSALWWLYFDVAAIFARRRLMQASGPGAAPARAARLQLPPPADGRRHRPLRLRPRDDARTTSTRRSTRAGSRALRRRRALPARGGHVPRPDDRPDLPAAHGRGGRPCSPSSRLAIAIPALAALALVSAVCALLVAYEAIAPSRASGPRCDTPSSRNDQRGFVIAVDDPRPR